MCGSTVKPTVKVDDRVTVTKEDTTGGTPTTNYLTVTEGKEVNLSSHGTLKQQRQYIYYVVQEELDGEEYQGYSRDRLVTGSWNNLHSISNVVAEMTGYRALRKLILSDTREVKPGSKREKFKNWIAGAEKYISTREFSNHFFNKFQEDIKPLNDNTFMADKVNTNHQVATEMMCYRMIKALDTKEKDESK